MNRIFSLLVFIAFAVLSISARADVIRPSEASPVFKDQVRKLIESYSEIKTALTAPDSKSAQQSAQKFIKTLRSFDATSLSPDEKSLYESAVQKLAPAAGAISQATDLDAQRENFKQMSNTMVQLIVANQQSAPAANTNLSEDALVAQKAPKSTTVLYEENGKKICLKYCRMGRGYFIAEENEKGSPYVGKEQH